MDHHAAVGATATHDGYADKYYSGRRSTSVYIPRFRNVSTPAPEIHAAALPTRSTPDVRDGRSEAAA